MQTYLSVRVCIHILNFVGIYWTLQSKFIKTMYKLFISTYYCFPQTSLNFISMISMRHFSISSKWSFYLYHSNHHVFGSIFSAKKINILLFFNKICTILTKYEQVVFELKLQLNNKKFFVTNLEMRIFNIKVLRKNKNFFVTLFNRIELTNNQCKKKWKYMFWFM